MDGRLIIHVVMLPHQQMMLEGASKAAPRAENGL